MNNKNVNTKISNILTQNQNLIRPDSEFSEE